jgi:hypothetical protein
VSNLPNRSQPITHGKATTYKNRGCRCDLCKKAWSVYISAYNARRKINKWKQYEKLSNVRGSGALVPDRSNGDFRTDLPNGQGSTIDAQKF